MPKLDRRPPYLKFKDYSAGSSFSWGFQTKLAMVRNLSCNLNIITYGSPKFTNRVHSQSGDTIVITDVLTPKLDKCIQRLGTKRDPEQTLDVDNIKWQKAQDIIK